jgi:CheY-like chemotaxis protein/two-component sensor histidine kinase
MVDDLLDVSRIISGKIHLNIEQVDLRDVIHRSLELTLPALQQRESMPSVTVPDGPVLVKGDPLRLAQVLCNLLQNAAKFTARDKHIGIELRVMGGRAQLSVADEGTGIPEALLPHVFERFVQGEQALQRASGGLGLGLPIAQSLIKLHGGLIRVESEVGKGSRFTVELPTIEAAASAATKDSAAPAREGRAMRLLVVDDNVDAADALAQYLGIEGHEVRIAGSAEEALDLLRHELPEAAILDIGLPGMDGYELARRLRADPRTQSIVLLALTGYGRDPDRQQALAAGFDDHFVKPVQLDALMLRLGQLL